MSVPVTLEFTVDRTRWLRGEGSERSSLFRPEDGKMCCLGFACLAAGHTEEDIADVSSPNGIAMKPPAFQCLLPHHNSPEVGDVMEVNDGEDTDEGREAFITERLAKIGMRVTFVG
jgi:hypothetical protein